MMNKFAVYLLVVVAVNLVLISLALGRIAEHVEEITHGLGLG